MSSSLSSLANNLAEGHHKGECECKNCECGLEDNTLTRPDCKKIMKQSFMRNISKHVSLL